MSTIKRTLQIYFQSINKFYKKSISTILFAIHFSIYKVDHYFIYKTLQIKQYKRYIPIFFGLSIFIFIFFYRIELFNILSTDDSFKALNSLTLSLGSALVGVTAIAFMLIVFSLQVNIERLPYGLFYTLNSDKKLMSLLEATFFLAILIACLSLIQNSNYAVIIFLILLESTFIIFFLLYFTYQRALKLINPHEQLNMIVEKTIKSLKWWDKRFKRAEPIIKNSNEDDKFDWKRSSFFILNPHYFSEVKNALNFIDSITQRHLDTGDYIVSEMALNTFISINSLYIKAKEKTFFSSSPFLETWDWNDEIINKTLEHLRLNFSINLKKSDERALNQLLLCYVKLAQVYTSIEYRIETDAKAHANLASQYLIDDTEKLMQLRNPDLLIDGIRSLENLVNWYIKYGLLTDTVMMIESIGKLGMFAALTQDQQPVTQTAMNAFGSIMQRLLVSKNDISFVLEKLNDQTMLLVSIILKQPNLYNHPSLLGTYYSYSDTSLLKFLTDLTNALLEQETLDKDARKLLNNVAIFSDKSYTLNKNLFLLALKNQSSLFHNILVWIDHFSYLLMMLSTIKGSKKEFKKDANWYLSIISWIPEDSVAIRYAEIYSLTETLFEAGEKYIEQELVSEVPTIIDLLISWSFKLGKYDKENTYKCVLGILGSTYLTLLCKCDYTSVKLLKQIEDNMKKYILSDGTLSYICEMIDKAINGEMRNFGINRNIEKAIIQLDNNDINDLLEKIKLILKK